MISQKKLLQIINKYAKKYIKNTNIDIKIKKKFNKKWDNCVAYVRYNKSKDTFTINIKKRLLLFDKNYITMVILHEIGHILFWFIKAKEYEREVYAQMFAYTTSILENSIKLSKYIKDSNKLFKDSPEESHKEAYKYLTILIK